MTGAARGEFFSDVDASGQAEAAERYLRAAADRAAATRRAGYELLGVAESWSVLDVGCGLGEVCADLAELVGLSGRVVGVDVSAEMITRARERWSHLATEFDVAEAEALGFEDATFDAARAERVIQHLQNPARAIAEMARVTRRGGRVFVLDVVHDATVFATDYPGVWEAIRGHGAGAVRKPRAGLFPQGVDASSGPRSSAHDRRTGDRGLAGESHASTSRCRGRARSERRGDRRSGGR
jgi:SAM-dependent methyltransferase